MMHRQGFHLVGQLLPRIRRQYLAQTPVRMDTTTRRNNRAGRQAGFLNEVHQTINGGLLRVVLVEFLQVLKVLLALFDRQSIDRFVLVGTQSHQSNWFDPFSRDGLGNVQIDPECFDANDVSDRTGRVAVAIEFGFVGVTRSCVPDAFAVANQRLIDREGCSGNRCRKPSVLRSGLMTRLSGDAIDGIRRCDLDQMIVGFFDGSCRISRPVVRQGFYGLKFMPPRSGQCVVCCYLCEQGATFIKFNPPL